MKILFVFGFPPKIGGHYKSALAILKPLSYNGHELYLAAPSWPETGLKMFAPARCIITSVSQLSYYYPFFNLFAAFRIIRECRTNRIDVIHAQDFRCSPPCFLAALLLKKAFVYTKAGGPVNENFPPQNVETVFYSQELVDGMTRKYNISKDNISLIKARIDLSCFGQATVTQPFLRKYGLPIARKKIVMAMRLAKQKRPWLKAILGLAMKMNRQKAYADIVVAGDGPLFPDLLKEADRINAKAANGRFLHLIGPVFDIEEMNQLYNYADLVVGHGRGILEAMACGKTVVVLGEKGQGEVVHQGNIDEVAEFNFSGRHLRNKAISHGELPTLIFDLLQDDDTLQTLGIFSQHYIKTQMDAKIGARQIVGVYDKALIRDNLWKAFLKWYTKLSFNALRASLKYRLGLS